MISLVRCDDRLIHGQCMTRIVQHFFIKEIIVVDDYTANNTLLKSIFEKAVPPDMKAQVVSVEGAKTVLSEYISNDISTLVLCKSPLTAVQLFKEVDNLSDGLMIGPVAMKAGAQEMQRGTYMTADELAAVAEMDSMGISVYFQVVPGQKRYDWDEMKKKIK